MSKESAIGQPLTMSSREIADLCETRHNQIVDTIERLIGSGVLRESRKTTRRVQPPGGGRPTDVYDLTKRDTLVVASGYKDELRARIIDRWLELEGGQQYQIPQTLGEALQLAADQAKQIESMREDVEAHERLTKADGSLSITEAAKALGMRPKDLFSWMSCNGWIYKRMNGSSWLGYQAKCNLGLLEHKTTTVLRADGSEKIVEQVRVAPMGLSKLAKLTLPTARIIA